MPALHLTTWNLNGLDPADLDVRTEAACLALLLRPDPPDVVMLQEVVGRSWHAHLKHHFAAAGYVPVPADPPRATRSEYFCVLLVRKTLPIEHSGADPFPGSEMGRQLVWATIDWSGRSALVATSHLESGREASAIRVAQLGAVVDGLLTHEGPAVFGADTNLRVAEEARVPRLDEVTDAWVAAGSRKDDRATWPSVPRDRRPGARFDRVLVKGCDVTSFAVAGQRAPGLPGAPSDHLRIEVTLAVG